MLDVYMQAYCYNTSNYIPKSSVNLRLNHKTSLFFSRQGNFFLAFVLCGTLCRQTYILQVNPLC